MTTPSRRRKPHVPEHPEFAVVLGAPYRRETDQPEPDPAQAEPEVVDESDPLFHDPNAQQ